MQCQLFVQWWEDAQTKCTRHHPWGGDDVYALGCVILVSQAMVGNIAIAPDAMIDTCVCKIFFLQPGFWDLVQLYVEYCTIRSHMNK